jgi:hypothetical protein
MTEYCTISGKCIASADQGIGLWRSCARPTAAEPTPAAAAGVRPGPQAQLASRQRRMWAGGTGARGAPTPHPTQKKTRNNSQYTTPSQPPEPTRSSPLVTSTRALTPPTTPGSAQRLPDLRGRRDLDRNGALRCMGIYLYRGGRCCQVRSGFAAVPPFRALVHFPDPSSRRR